MYQKPELNRVGEAENVILGFIPGGDDVDTNYVVQAFEFAEEIDFEGQ